MAKERLKSPRARMFVALDLPERVRRDLAEWGKRELRDPVQRPERGRARLFALPVESAGTVELQAALQEKLVAARLYEPEKRPFWPHVTVARVRREERGSQRPAPVKKLPGALPKGLLRAFGGVRLTLYRSELQPQGAQYTPLAQVELPTGGRQ